ncbi:MAG: zinc ABC transporter substrate-binding protein [Rhodobacteraceae bacterium]|nr:zinc ABC transporter substrate-binding protein [Paracoccaceae bacterium]
MRYTISTALASLIALPAFAEVPRVVTDIPPVHALVAQVMGDLGTPELLLEKGADEHDFALKPSQMGAISDAGLVVWIGPELTPWLDRALESSEAGRLGLLAAAGTYRQDFGAATHDHEVAEETGHDHDAHDHEEHAAEEHDHDHAAEGPDHDHDEHGHSHTGLDPHAWLDPGNGRLWLGLIAAELGRLDPEHAATYTGNAEAAATRLAALDAEMAAQLAPLAEQPFITFHDAYGYLAGHYGLEYAGAVALGDASSPGAAHLTELKDRIAAGGITCLFPEAQHDPALMTQIAGDARIGGVLDPVGSTLEPGPGAYEALLRSLTGTLADCLKG